MRDGGSRKKKRVEPAGRRPYSQAPRKNAAKQDAADLQSRPTLFGREPRQRRPAVPSRRATTVDGGRRRVCRDRGDQWALRPKVIKLWLPVRAKVRRRSRRNSGRSLHVEDVARGAECRPGSAAHDAAGPARSSATTRSAERDRLG